MKLIYGYVILFISFFGIIFLQNYSRGDQLFSPILYIKNHYEQKQFDKRLKELESFVDSLIISEDTQEKLDLDLFPSTSDLNHQKKFELHFRSLNEAVKIRNSKNDMSSLAQIYINLAYEMGNNDWYSAEQAWFSDSFKNRISVKVSNN